MTLATVVTYQEKNTLEGSFIENKINELVKEETSREKKIFLQHKSYNLLCLDIYKR